jgi:hypothetical protein
MNEIRKLMETLNTIEEGEKSVDDVLKYFDKSGKVKDGYEVYTRDGELVSSVSRQSRDGWWNLVTQSSWRGRQDSQTLDSGVAEMQVYKVTRKRIV